MLHQRLIFFNGKFYNQIDGVVTCSPLTPVLSNTSMGFYKTKWLTEYNLNKPKRHLRCVDDIENIKSNLIKNGYPSFLNR